MTTPKSRTPRRSISIATDPLDTPAASAAPAPAPRRKAKTASRAQPTAQAEPPMIDPDLRVGEESWDEESFKLTANIPKSLHRRSAGVVAYAQMHGLGDEAKDDISSLTDLVRIALHEKVRYYEQTLYEGNPFPVPRSLPKGRR